jgi:putative transposase
MIDHSYQELSLRQQLDLLNINRSGYYYRQEADSKQLDQELANLIHEICQQYPFFGYRKVTAILNREGFLINRKKVQRLMRKMNLQAIFPGKNKSQKNTPHLIYPYLLKNLKIERINHVWTTDITYIRMNEGWIYFLAILDLYSRYILAFAVSTTMEAEFCIDALSTAMMNHQHPEIFNTDQGSQFTSTKWIELLTDNKIKISMDGKGRCFDNIHVERLWRTIKYEEVYLKSYDSVKDAREQLMQFVDFYNCTRPHQALDYKTPAEIYFRDKLKADKLKIEKLKIEQEKVLASEMHPEGLSHSHFFYSPP